jgi:hypothetical protein
MSNVSSVSSGTLSLFSWNELQNASTFTLSAAMDASSDMVTLAQPVPGYVGQVLQLEAELLTVLGVNSTNNTYQVARAALGSAATTHAAGVEVLHLDQSTLVVPFALNFFENRASLNFTHNITAPDVRVCAAQLFVTNAFGDSEGSAQCYTTQIDGGLRTLSGGQFAIQVGSTLATQQNAAPALLIEASHAVRDVRASLMQAPAGYNITIDLLQNGTEYCSLVIPTGATVSNVLDGVSLLPLMEGNNLTMNVTLDVIAGFTGSINPGRDLTVTIRL